VDTQQLAGKVAQLETRVAALEDEGKIIKGEVKQVLTEIRSAVLARENPFDNSVPQAPAPAAPAAIPQPGPVSIVVTPEAVPAPAPGHAAEPPAAPSRAPVPIRPSAAEQPAAPEAPRWTLVTIAALSAWAEDAMRRLGPLRVDILLDLCEASGHLSADARKALSRITELDVAEPAQAPSQNETAALLRQLEALLCDKEETTRVLRAA